MKRLLELGGQHFYVDGRMGDVINVVNYDTAEGWMLRLWSEDGHEFMSRAMEQELVDLYGMPDSGEIEELDDYIAEKRISASHVALIFNNVQVKYLQLKEACCVESKDGDGQWNTHPDAVQNDGGWGDYPDAHEGDTQGRPQRILFKKREGPQWLVGQEEGHHGSRIRQTK